MYLSDIKMNDFRNYNTVHLFLHRGMNILYGDNAQGKTNLLEAIYVLAITKSYRSIIDNHLIQTGKTCAKIIGNMKNDIFQTKYEVTIHDRNKFLKIDNDSVKKVSNYLSKINVIIFYPEDLNLIKGSPNTRRRYLNLELSQLYVNYYNILNDFNRLLKMRNDYIKSNSIQNLNLNYFNILTEYYIDKSILLYRMRKKFIDKLNDKISEIFFNITGFPDFHLIYRTSILFDKFDDKFIKEQMHQHILENRDREFRYKTSLYGPHRDDIEFYIGNMNVKIFGSQGQQRIAVLSLKLAEIEIFYRQTGHYPILLLDDVFSELDDSKKNNLLSYLNEEMQTIITTTDLSNIDDKIVKQAKLIEVENGTIKKIEEVK